VSEILAAGQLRKMHTALQAPVEYQLPLGESLVPMNVLIGETLTLDFLGEINCIHCGRKTRKSFQQGYCYPCFTRLAQCDSCIVSPEKCHYHEGTCREPEWGEQHCMIDHIVYLANSSGIKVGITRGSQVPTRWMDQGAIQALPVFRVSTRLLSGLVETVYKQHVADRTNWRAMLKGQVDPMELALERDRLFEECSADITALQNQHGLQAIQQLQSEDTVEISYPVEEYPVKIVSFNLDKEPTVSGRLMGIKGQYLIFDAGVINMRKYGGYQLQLSRH
jgi:hypothetical protein